MIEVAITSGGLDKLAPFIKPGRVFSCEFPPMLHGAEHKSKKEDIMAKGNHAHKKETKKPKKEKPKPQPPGSRRSS